MKTLKKGGALVLFGRKREFNMARFLRKAKRFDGFELQKYDALAAFLKESGETALPRPLGLRLLVIADTHGCLEDAEGLASFKAFLEHSAAHDLCVLLGDISPRDLTNIASLISTEDMIAVLGNHDPFDLYARHHIRDLSRGGVFTCRGVKFVGMGGTFRYKEEAFPSLTQYESLRLAVEMERPDVLVSHDKAFDAAVAADAAHAGLIGLTYCVYKACPAAHLYGHLHERQRSAYENGTQRLCAYRWESIEL